MTSKKASKEYVGRRKKDRWAEKAVTSKKASKEYVGRRKKDRWAEKDEGEFE